jgi:hypothetical protein
MEKKKYERPAMRSIKIEAGRIIAQSSRSVYVYRGEATGANEGVW